MKKVRAKRTRHNTALSNHGAFKRSISDSIFLDGERSESDDFIQIEYSPDQFQEKILAFLTKYHGLPNKKCTCSKCKGQSVPYAMVLSDTQFDFSKPDFVYYRFPKGLQKHAHMFIAKDGRALVPYSDGEVEILEYEISNADEINNQLRNDSTMNIEKFWSIIDTSIEEANGSDLIFGVEICKQLLQLNKFDVTAWNDIFAEQKNKLDTDEIRRIAASIDNHISYSDDGFWDCRAWIVSRGSNIYYKVLNDPRYLLKIAKQGDNIEFEEFQYIAQRILNDI